MGVTSTDGNDGSGGLGGHGRGRVVGRGGRNGNGVAVAAGSRAGGSNRGSNDAGRSRNNDAGRTRDNDAGRSDAVLLGDAELGRVLVLAIHIVNELHAVVGDISLELGSRGPGVGAGVGDADDNGGTNGDNIGRGATEKDEGDGVGGGWLPSDGEGLASRDDLQLRLSASKRRVSGRVHATYLVQRAGDGVARGLANGGVLRRSNAGKEGDNGGLGEHVGLVCLVVLGN